MEKERNQMAERILQLTLEIIYLLTGEDNIFVKKTSGERQNSNMVPLHSLLFSEINNDKILEVTQKMIDLLTGEVSGAGNSGTLSSNRQGMCLDGDCIIVCVRFLRCQDVSMGFSLF
ncbi:oocyte zinc finger protein XlCOF29-like [Lithobates pipiens]